jgi:hypothetical protein
MPRAETGIQIETIKEIHKCLMFSGVDETTLIKVFLENKKEIALEKSLKGG